ncbi:hypothetical protein QF044_001298 [Chryseobacterium sp. W4I1]|nr:hypothetical protein [Chryseobacterium sp. W4I1]
MQHSAIAKNDVPVNRFYFQRQMKFPMRKFKTFPKCSAICSVVISPSKKSLKIKDSKAFLVTWNR